MLSTPMQLYGYQIEKARSADARSHPKKFPLSNPSLKHPREHLIYAQASFRKWSSKNRDYDGWVDWMNRSGLLIRGGEATPQKVASAVRDQPRKLSISSRGQPRERGA